MNWLIARLKEPSTWRGIILLLTVCGLKLQPDQQEAIIAAGLAVVGLIGVFTKDEPKHVNIQLPPIEMQSKSQFDERGFNKQSRFEEDDGYISRDALRSQLRVSAEDYPKIYNERRDDEPGFNG